MNYMRKLALKYIKNPSKYAHVLLRSPAAVCSTFSNGNFYRKQSTYIPNSAQSVILDDAQSEEEEEKISKEVISKINDQIKNKTHSRLFAVIQLCDRKFKITDEDIIAVGSFFRASVGDRIRLEKVLAVGSTDFTLLGRPLLSKDLIRVDATVIEKTYIVPRPLFRMGIHYQRLHWFRTPYVLIRINSINFVHSLDDLPSVEGLEDR
ncbi:39S ribosomal protein L21, mitochondrial, partial [Stegodyphus mimosarum]